MQALTQQRCFRHPEREAAVRCQECRRFFCRECTTEHEERMVCAACLRKLASHRGKGAEALRALREGLECLAGLLALWLIFYGLGYSLSSMPSEFHEGTVWKQFLEDEP